MNIWTYIGQRLVLGAVTLLVAVTFVFFLLHLTPGDPIDLILEQHFTQESYEAVQRRLGLDRPLIEQYSSYLGGLFRGELGVSFRTRQDISVLLARQFPYTLQLAIAAFLVSIVIGIPAGIMAALYRNRWIDRVGMFVALIGVCVPNFVVGIMLMLVFSLQLGWFPTVGVGSGDLASSFRYLVLPSITLGTAASALVARVTRSSMLEALSQDYIRTARAKGSPERTVVSRHALRNAMMPVLTVMGIDFGGMLAGTAIVEIVFSRPGVGQTMIEGLLARDYPQIQGTLLFFVFVIVAVNTVVDVLYTLVDPRVRVA